MARGINKVTLIGNLGNDPEVKYMPSGGAVTNVSLATDESYRDKNTGNIVEKVEWHRLVFFNRLAEIAGEFLKKGSKVYAEGSLRTRKWEKDGVDHYTTEIVVSEMRMLDGRSDDSNKPQQNSSNQQARQQHTGQQNNSSNPQRHQNPPTQQQGGFDSFDDDIPF